MKDKSEIEKLNMQLDWFHDFVDYIQSMMPNTYDNACEYADNEEDDRIGENNGN